MSILTRRAALRWSVLSVSLALASPAAANVALTRVSSDPFANASSQHATEVEPDTFAAGRTVIGAFQVGRFFDGGSSDIGWARSTDGGSNWTNGFLPGLTFNGTQPGTSGTPFERVSDASVAYDRRHGVWLVSSLPVPNATAAVPYIFVSRSTDGGATWGLPVRIPPPAANKVDLDKNWTVCDNSSTSPYYGHCYTEFDDFGAGDLEEMSTSADGGQTWSVPVPTASNDRGLGGQPLVQPDGTVVVPFQTNQNKEAAFRSTDGGATWRSGVTIAAASTATTGGNLRTSALPSAEIDGGGKVFVAWQDCRFRVRCASNDIVFSTSSDGVNWSPVTRVPIDSTSSGADHFIPGLAVDPSTAGGSAHVALSYYFYPDATCAGGCRLEVGYISSPDGGANWSAPTQLAGPMTLSQIADTSQGRMVGDYISTSFNSAGAAVPMFAVGNPPTGAAAFDEGMYVPRAPLAVADPAHATAPASSAGVQSAGGTTQRAARVIIRSN
jgi:hypothetical protein